MICLNHQFNRRKRSKMCWTSTHRQARALKEEKQQLKHRRRSQAKPRRLQKKSRPQPMSKQRWTRFSRRRPTKQKRRINALLKKKNKRSTQGIKNQLCTSASNCSSTIWTERKWLISMPSSNRCYKRAMSRQRREMTTCPSTGRKSWFQSLKFCKRCLK